MESVFLSLDSPSTRRRHSRRTIYGSADRRLTSAVHNQRYQINQLPLKFVLLRHISKSSSQGQSTFRDIRECSKEFQKSFNDAWKAIERGSMKKLKYSIEAMKSLAEKEDLDGNSYLNVCRLQTTVSKVSEKVVIYYTTLLALAAVYGEFEMVEYLICEGTSLDVENPLTGSPLTQLFVNTMLSGDNDEISLDIVEQLIAPDSLNAKVYYEIPKKTHDPYNRSSPWVASPLSFAILLQRFDVAEVLTERGANPLQDLGEGTLSCMVEYLHFGTNRYFSWLFQEHLQADEIAQFIKDLLPFKPAILGRSCMMMFTECYKHPVHAILTCGNEDVVESFLGNDKVLLTKMDPNGKTALQIAAEQGDVTTINILLKLSGTECDEEMNIKEALMAAAQNGRTEIVNCLLQRDFDLGAQIVDSFTMARNTYADLSLLSTIFEAFRDYKQELLLHKVDRDDNTISHVAAANGNIRLFKLTFPLKSVPFMFSALQKKNAQGKTPLQLAIDNGHLDILRTLKQFGVERKFRQGAEQLKEEKDWKALWESISLKLILYACYMGSADAVQILFCIVRDCDFNLVSMSKSGLSSAAVTGKRDILKYFLTTDDICKCLTPDELSNALLVAAREGHSRCVELLLQSKKKVDVQKKDHTDGFNCLMKAIDKGHRETVLTIVSDPTHGYKSLQICTHDKHIKPTATPMRMLIINMPEIAEWVLNSRVLTHHRQAGEVEYTGADEFEFIDEQCYLEDPSQNPLTFHNITAVETFPMNTLGTTSRGSGAHLLSTEVVIPSDDLEQQCCTSDSASHALKLMVMHDREALLHHPLVTRYINYKWMTIGIAGLVFYFVLYIIFLSMLTAFALLIPRPGPGNYFCSFPVNTTFGGNSTFLGDDNVSMSLPPLAPDENLFSGDGATAPMPTTTGMSSTEGIGISSCPENPPSTVLKFLRTISILLMIFALIYLVLEAIQLYHRKQQYFREVENYIQVTMYSLTIIFVCPPGLYGSECWCFASWRWQIGAVALFLAWFNCCFVLKHWPLVGQPVTMLINVYLNFFGLFYLPLLLLFTFGFPLYMLHVQEGSDFSTTLLTFTSAIGAVWNILLQTTGELDTNQVFIDRKLFYPFLTYLLLILFIIAMPVLFNNFLIGMAVGETEEERKKASFTLIKRKVRFTFEVENSLKFLKLKGSWLVHNPWVALMKAMPWLRARLNQRMLDNIDRKNKRALSHMKSQFSAEDNQAELNALREDLKSLRQLITEVED